MICERCGHDMSEHSVGADQGGSRPTVSCGHLDFTNATYCIERGYEGHICSCWYDYESPSTAQ